MFEAKIHERKVKTPTPSRTALRFLTARRDAAPSSVVRGVIDVGCDAEGSSTRPLAVHVSCVRSVFTLQLKYYSRAIVPAHTLPQ
jgi:hypothetical protein